MNTELATITNFVVINDRIATAGQPSESQIRRLAESGYHTVVNLGLADTEYALTDEAATVSEAGMTYHHIPVDFQGPTLDDLRTFFSVMERNADRRVFVHCALNYRVSCFTALYGEARLGWSGEQAEQHIARLWRPDLVWSDFLREGRMWIRGSGVTDPE